MRIFYVIEMFDDEIERICEVDPLTGKVQNAYTVYVVYPASGYATKQELSIVPQIRSVRN